MVFNSAPISAPCFVVVFSFFPDKLEIEGNISITHSYLFITDNVLNQAIKMYGLCRMTIFEKQTVKSSRGLEKILVTVFQRCKSQKSVPWKVNFAMNAGW